jgi:hypothetical protein
MSKYLFVIMFLIGVPYAVAMDDQKLTINFGAYGKSHPQSSNKKPVKKIKIKFKNKVQESDIYDEDDIGEGLSVESQNGNNEIFEKHGFKRKRGEGPVIELPKKRFKALAENARNVKVRHMADLILQEVSKEDILDILDIVESTFRTYVHHALQAKMINHDDLLYLRENLMVIPVARAIKAQEPLDQILHNNNLENKALLNRVISRTYKVGALSPEDTFYLKSDKSVIHKRGETKQKIIAFLTEVSAGSATATVSELCAQFNESRHACIRPIEHSTFREHVKELTNSGQLSAELLDFYERCKNKRHNINGELLHGAPRIKQKAASSSDSLWSRVVKKQ